MACVVEIKTNQLHHSSDHHMEASLESVYITPKIFGVDHYNTLTY